MQDRKSFLSKIILQYLRLLACLNKYNLMSTNLTVLPSEDLLAASGPNPPHCQYAGLGVSTLLFPAIFLSCVLKEKCHIALFSCCLSLSTIKRVQIKIHLIVKDVISRVSFVVSWGPTGTMAPSSGIMECCKLMGTR